MSPKDLKADEHLLIIRDSKYFINTYGSKKIYGAANLIGGTEISINRFAIKDIINGMDNNTVPHEFGHSLGLLHVDENTSKFNFLGFKSDQFWDQDKQKLDSNNVMFTGSSRYMHDLSSVDLLPKQIELIITNYKRGLININKHETEGNSQFNCNPIICNHELPS